MFRPMFELSEQQVTLQKYNSRTETHGKEEVPAADLKFEAMISSDLLAMFHPTLRSFLFHKKEGIEGDLANQAHDAPNRRFPGMGTLPWDTNLVGAALTVHHGLGGSSNIEIDECKVNNVTITALEGGTCRLSFRVQCRPDERQRGILTGYGRKQTMSISLEAADVEQPADKDQPKRRAPPPHTRKGSGRRPSAGARA